ncbi:hypothetical protein AXX12_09635 [Anaerosporomusa subterranea]|uniref:Xylose isomerase-like TIM barrel domain-containing protein n=1 Tax=Anaerosporomusa subterranea TaxID=1794912 RepID=A0A154BRV8_ANASB|nr:sugar phosphate isomerase/epimerase family protein [Anaerosporomusa subterranea]KYZ76671.1 hypothetical protein AXX12_09635 [Anaerosporomusa subterranea]
MIKLSATVPLQYDTVFSPFAACEFDQGLEWLNLNRFDGIEVCIAQPNTVNVPQLKQKLKQYQLTVSTISTGQAFGLEGLSLSSSDTDIRTKAITRMKEHIDLATQIGFPLVTVGLLRGKGTPETRRQLLGLFSDSLSCCAAYAQKQGVRLMVEPINQQETCLLNGTTETLEFLADCPFDNVGVLLDTFHSNLEDTSIEDAIHALGAKLFHVHFADSNRGLPGTGEINFLVVVKALIEHQFQGFVSLETLSIPNKEIVKRESYSRLAQCFLINKCERI